MSRPRKPISPSGFLRCSRCKEVLHISLFHMQDDRVDWFTDKDGGVWGRPSSWCKGCMRDYHQNRRANGPQDTPESLEEAGLYHRTETRVFNRATHDPEVEGDTLRERPLGVPLGPPVEYHPADDPDWLPDEAIEALNKRPTM